jgi:A/G-specific adenine glycosylase
MRAHSPAELLNALDEWYARHARRLPWRVAPEDRGRGVLPDPYLVWLSEVMLQQTTIPHAAPYFDAFRVRWPGVGDLAKASWEDVSAAWAGLGYYSRARNLHACAQVVAQRGCFPQDRDGLLALPGVGPYTAAAIAAIAYDAPVAPVDGNIERVMSRVYAIGSDATDAGWRAAKKDITARAQVLFDALPEGVKPGNIAQAMMDLGATVCTPRKPVCAICPLSKLCAARKAGEQELYPVKAAKKAQPVRYGSAFVAVGGDKVLLVRRPSRGLLGGMVMPPTGEWGDVALGGDDAMQGAPAGFKWEKVGEVRHVFTHFALTLGVWRGEAGARDRVDGLKQDALWVDAEEALASLPTVGRKAVAMALREMPAPLARDRRSAKTVLKPSGRRK